MSIVESLMEGVLCDELRVWKKGGDFIANTKIIAPEGKIFRVKVVAVEDHPRPPRRRKRRTG